MYEEKRGMILPLATKVPSKRANLTKIMFTFSMGLSFGFTLATLILSPYSSRNVTASFGSPFISPELSFLASFETNLDLNSTFVHEFLKSAEEVAARKLAQEVRIMCIVLTMPKNHRDRAEHVRDTWGRHCNNIHFISSKYDASLPTTNVRLEEGKNLDWAKMEGAFNYLYEVRLKDFDWVVKTDHDNFIVVENLRTMLTSYSQNEPFYFELNYEINDTGSSGSNTASYVLSRESVIRLVTEGYNGSKHAECSGKDKQVQIGSCFKSLGLKLESTRDELNRRRCLQFHAANDLKDIQNLEGEWWKNDYIYWPMNAGLNCCSAEPISFHRTQVTALYMLEYMIYHVRPHSLIRHTQIKLPEERLKGWAFSQSSGSTSPTTLNVSAIETTVKPSTTITIKSTPSSASSAAPSPTTPSSSKITQGTSASTAVTAVSGGSSAIASTVK